MIKRHARGENARRQLTQTGKKISSEGGKEEGNHGSGGLLEAAVVVLLPISAGDGAVHAGAVGADRVQYPSGWKHLSGRANMLIRPLGRISMLARPDRSQNANFLISQTL